MMVLLELKERLKSFYGRFAVPVTALMKFFLCFAAVWMMNQNIGFMTKLKNPLVPVLVSLAGAFLPYGAISFLLAAVMLAHIYAVSFEIALLAGVFLIIVALLYFGLQPRDSYWLILTPLAFGLRMPFVIPVLAGLAGGIISIIPVSCGVAVYYIMAYVKQNAGVLTNDAGVDITQKYVQIIRALVSNQVMFLFIAVCAVGILAVYLLRTLSVDYAWSIAVVLGMVAQLAVVFAGELIFDISVPLQEILAGTVLSLAIAGIYHFFVYAVDYSRTEYINYEDDDYVYYVKAVPKVSVSTTDVRVQRINNPKKARRGGRQE